MQEWVRTMVLMVRARVLSPEQDSPYLGFCCRCLMELLTKTLFSTILLGGGFFYRFRLQFLKLSTKDCSSCVPVVVHPDLLVDS
jgi:hypothetical protein